MKLKDRSGEERDYNGKLMGIGGPGEAYILNYLQHEYVKVIPIGQQNKKRDYACYIDDKCFEYVEAKTDTLISKTKKIPWEPFRLESKGQKAYISWGYNTQVKRCIYFSPQSLCLYDVRNDDVRSVIWNHIYDVKSSREIYCVPTITDNDRITFIFTVPLELLSKYGVLKTINISEYPLTTPTSQQGKLQ